MLNKELKMSEPNRNGIKLPARFLQTFASDLRILNINRPDGILVLDWEMLKGCQFVEEAVKAKIALKENYEIVMMPMGSRMRKDLRASTIIPKSMLKRFKDDNPAMRLEPFPWGIILKAEILMGAPQIKEMIKENDLLLKQYKFVLMQV